MSYHLHLASHKAVRTVFKSNGAACACKTIKFKEDRINVAMYVCMYVYMNVCICFYVCMDIPFVEE